METSGYTVSLTLSQIALIEILLEADFNKFDSLRNPPNKTLDTCTNKMLTDRCERIVGTLAALKAMS